MIGLDTNVLIRLLKADDPEQTPRVVEFLKQARADKELLLVSVPAICELVWVLRSVFGESRAETMDAIEKLLIVEEFVIDEEDAVRRAVHLTRSGPGGFTDYLIGELNRAKDCRFTVTFDRKLAKSPAFQLL